MPIKQPKDWKKRILPDGETVAQVGFERTNMGCYILRQTLDGKEVGSPVYRSRQEAIIAGRIWLFSFWLGGEE